ncbi:hypothetical protein DSM112329_03672 [Paraconexibacter sp. AEG42_29]|uniref:VOC domain-containing protein n=1 Tax=Paraconexibacter sp. AEG42_29 TaxID=2997339 RepID=A0AAU7AYR5_9ACTN
MDSVSIKQMVHANICVRDLDRTIPFYEMLGFEVFSDMRFVEGSRTWPGLGLPEGREFRAVFMKIPGENPVPFLDIIEFRDPQPAGEPYATLHNIGICRLCFEVADIDATAAVLKANGVELVSEPAHYETALNEPADGVEARFLCFKDPDGTFLEYAQFAGQATDVLG